MNTKSRQHAKSYLLSLILLLGVFSTSVIQSVDAFTIGLPDIPFLNFDFDNDSPKADSSSIIDLGTITNIIPKSSSDEVDSSDNVDTDFENTNSGSNNVQSKDEMTRPQSASLPFPANMMNTVYSNENEHTDEVNKSPLNLDGTLPLVGEYADVPSTFLSDITTPNDDDVIPGQFIVVFKDDDTTVTDFFSMVSNEIGGNQDIEVLQVYENVLNGLTIKVPDEKIVEEIEQLPIVDYVEKDMMAEAFAQTLPSAVLEVLALDTEPITRS